MARDLATQWRTLSDAVAEQNQAVEAEAASEIARDGGAPGAFDAPEGIRVYVQRPLSALGYDPGPIDGHLGSRTWAAIRAFEADHSMAPTAVPSEHLAIELLAALLDRWAQQREVGSAGLGR